MAFEVLSIVTNAAKQRMSVMFGTGKSFKVTSFVIGDGGHDPLDPTTALAPDPTQLSCSGNLIFGPEVVDSLSFGPDFCPVFECVLEEQESVAVISSICLIAEIVYSPIPSDPELGDTFVFSIGHFPLKVKTDLDVFTFRLTVQV